MQREEERGERQQTCLAAGRVGAQRNAPFPRGKSASVHLRLRAPICGRAFPRESEATLVLGAESAPASWPAQPAQPIQPAQRHCIACIACAAPFGVPRIARDRLGRG